MLTSKFPLNPEYKRPINNENKKMNEPKKLTWWEKTVEYYFVQKHCPEAIAPLDGKEEALYGDALLQKNGRFSLIEFKKDKSTLTNEKDKFECYETAKKVLTNFWHEKEYKNCHYFIYGNIDSKNNFELKAEHYFYGDEKCIKNILNEGICFNTFREYLDELAECKKVAYKNQGSGGRVETSSVAYVCSVKGKNIVLSESKLIGLELMPKLIQKQEKEKEETYDMQPS